MESYLAKLFFTCHDHPMKIIIVGAGITGHCFAYHLLQKGLSAKEIEIWEDDRFYPAASACPLPVASLEFLPSKKRNPSLFAFHQLWEKQFSPVAIHRGKLQLPHGNADGYFISSHHLFAHLRSSVAVLRQRYDFSSPPTFPHHTLSATGFMLPGANPVSGSLLHFQLPQNSNFPFTQSFLIKRKNSQLVYNVQLREFTFGTINVPYCQLMSPVKSLTLHFKKEFPEFYHHLPTEWTGVRGKGGGAFYKLGFTLAPSHTLGVVEDFLARVDTYSKTAEPIKRSGHV